MGAFLDKYGQAIITAVGQHIFYVLVSVSAASIIAVILGVLLSRIPSKSKFFLPFLGMFQTIPGIVFIGILMMYIGMRPLTVVVALTVYAVFPILKNTYAGLIGVNKSYIEVAKGCGMNPRQILFRVELPMSLPSIFSGIRMSLIYTVSWAVLAAMIGQGGLGEFIYRGIDANVKEYIIIGSVPTALLAFAFRAAIDRLEKLCVPAGLRGDE